MYSNILLLFNGERLQYADLTTVTVPVNFAKPDLNVAAHTTRRKIYINSLSLCNTTRSLLAAGTVIKRIKIH